MNELHGLGVNVTDKAKAEAVHPRFVKTGLINAQKQSWKVFSEIKAALQTGLTELEAQKLAYAIFERHGVTKHWHRPYVRFGPGTALTFHDSLQKEYRLRDGDPVYIDIGPVWPDEASGLEYEGDVGDTFVFGTNTEADKCISAARELYKEAQEQWRSKKLSGESIYQFLKAKTEAKGFRFVDRVTGHRVADYPHTQYSKKRLSDLNFVPSDTVWILELQILHPTLPIGAFFEDLL